MNRVLMEFRCGKHTVRMRLLETGSYAITVTHSGLTLGEAPLKDETFEVAEVVDRGLAIHCFNHTVQQYQKEAL